MSANRWMTASGLAGITLFVVANYTNLFTGSAMIAGILQLAVNSFVFITWSRSFRRSSGFKKFVSFWGVIVPIIMATITFWKILLPAFLK